MVVSIHGGIPKSSISIGFSLINKPFWGTPIYGNPMKPHIRLLFGTMIGHGNFSADPPFTSEAFNPMVNGREEKHESYVVVKKNMLVTIVTIVLCP